jgi:hypothetical protein
MNVERLSFEIGSDINAIMNERGWDHPTAVCWC